MTNQKKKIKDFRIKKKMISNRKSYLKTKNHPNRNKTLNNSNSNNFNFKIWIKILK